MDRRLTALFALLAVGCAPSALEDAIAETGVDGPFDEVPAEGKYDGSAARGPSVASGVDTEVWAVSNAWSDIDTPAARAAGIAWEASSGLDWEQKFDRWVASLATEPKASGSGQTFVLTTPYGDRHFHAPTLECAEVAYFLRATFASWYHLPFYVQGWDAAGRQTMYAGHFGFVNSDGTRIGNFPRFRESYRDYESGWAPGTSWPSDTRLRGFRLGDDDDIAFLSTSDKELGAGAYFDEIFLNKRVGYFMRLLLLYFGSTNLADGANMFHVQPEAIAPGDILLERWQRRGIGHVMPIFRVERHAEDAIEVTVASGSMPRREPSWEEPNSARRHFTDEYTGGVGSNYDGDEYSHLGGGLKRWRSAVLRAGRWRNEVPVRDREVFINDMDYEAISARPARFGEILRSLTPEERRTVALSALETAREHLRMYPASCSARIRREDAFTDLYGVMAEEGLDKAQVDATFRTLEDYVFAELVYERSRTCCWNSTTSAMHEIIMSAAEAEQAAATASGMCVQPSAFRAETTGYDRWRTHAESLGRGAEWVAWSEDELCEQRAVPEDTIDISRAPTAYCDLGEPVTPPEPPPPGAGCDASGGSSRDAATALALGAERSARLCADEEDWFQVDATGSVTVRIAFSHAAGDLDLEVVGADGTVIGSSTSVQNEESVTATGPFFVKVYGYGGVANTYTILAQ